MPLDALVTGRIATLAGKRGFGFVEAVGIRDGRIAFAGSEIDLETRADPFTARFALDPDEVAIPGLTDAHLHLAQAAITVGRVDLSADPDIDSGLTRIGEAHRALTNGDAWLEGHGWDREKWNRWPTADDLEVVAPGRRVALWAHDHHGLWASHAALRTAGIDATTSDPAGGVIGRDRDGRPDGLLLESATRLVTAVIPSVDGTTMAAAIERMAGTLIGLGIVACHDPGGLAPDPDLAWSYPSYAFLADAGRLTVRVHASLRHDALATAIDRGLRSGAPLGGDPSGRALVGWQKLFADGSLGSRTAALLEEIEPDPGDPVPAARRRGVWNTPPAELAELAARAAVAGIATQIHAIGDAACRAALDALEGVARTALMPRIEHVQMLDASDRGRFAAAGIAASVQPIHLRSDADAARRLWGERAERTAYPWGSLAAAGAVLAFGSDAPVEPVDPWPGIVLAVTRRDPAWGADSAAFGPTEALSLERALRAACIDPAVSAGESNRGRLTVGQRADLIVVPAAVLDEPVEPGGALATARPRLVLVDGAVALEI